MLVQIIWDAFYHSIGLYKAKPSVEITCIHTFNCEMECKSSGAIVKMKQGNFQTGVSVKTRIKPFLQIDMILPIARNKSRVKGPMEFESSSDIK